MILKHLFITVAATAFISSQVFAEELNFGLGAGISAGLKLYFPINTKQLRIEPTLYIDPL